MHKRPEITAEYVRERLDYEPKTGVFYWKPLPGDDRRANAWNARYAGTVAGTIDKEGYRGIDLDKRHFRAGRLAWLHVRGAFPPELIDHRNRDRADDRLENLRPATHSQNLANSPARTPSGLKGVYWNTPGKWIAAIGSKGKTRRLGTFATPEEAHAAYCAAAIELHGDFARI